MSTEATVTAIFAPDRSTEAVPGPISVHLRRDILGVSISALTEAAALKLLDDAFATRSHRQVAFCNAHLVNLAAEDPGLRRCLDGFLVLPDGTGVDIASRVLYGQPFPDNLNGTDFIPALLAASRRRLRVMLLGARPGIADRAAQRLRADYPQHDVAVLCHGFFAEQDQAALLARLECEQPDLLLVAFGNPRQETWIAEHIRSRHCTVAAGVGALFDFLAGEVTRAPRSVRKTRFEWVYRLWLEPARLWRRYLLGNPLFLYRVLMARLSGRHAA